MAYPTAGVSATVGVSLAVDVSLGWPPQALNAATSIKITNEVTILIVLRISSLIKG
jgi:hypothetical protein